MKKQSALVIGASRGIGIAVVKHLSAQEINVVATWNTTEPDYKDSHVIWLQADITQNDSILSLKSVCAGRCFDFILVNAGVYGPEHQDPQLIGRNETEFLFTVNAVAPVKAMKTLMPLLRDNHKGVAGIMSSRLASLKENPKADMPLYAASKAALNVLTRSLLEATQEHGITLLSLHPGWVKTDMGGSNAPVEAYESAAGIVSQLMRYRGRGGHHFTDYAGGELEW
ncbi:SDR family NAD(P)-dependent oxidoreductase [Citrobacter freundii]